MSVSKTVIRNSALLATSHLISKFLYLALILILTRALGVEEFGRYSFSLAYAMLFLPFALMGFSALLIREISQNLEKAASIYHRISASILLFSLLATLACYLVGRFFFTNPDDQQIIGILSLYMMFDSWSRLTFSVFRGYQKMEYEAVVNVSERSLLFLVTLAGWYLNWSLPQFMWGFTATQLGKAAMGQFFIQRYFFPFKFSWDWPYLRYFLIEAFPFLLMTALGILSLRVDILMLKAFHGDASVGIFDAGRRLIESLSFISENLYSALFPALSALAVTEPQRFRDIFRQANKIMLVIALPLLAWLFILAPQIIDLLFEPEFADAAIALRWLSIFLVILFIKRLFLAAHNALGWQRLVSVTLVMTLLLNVVFNYLLIPDYLYFGASVATLISEGFTLLILIWVLHKRSKMVIFDMAVLRAVLAGILLFGLVYLCRSLPLLLIPILSGVAYLLLLHLLRVFTPSERQQFRKFIPAKIGRYF